ncbi:toll/interleukin-1 receptor domain-containing protein [Marivirga sp. S37H4]|uniref:Toll/interleukin-1 receptor domain-containing protein n=1 Tax=Marivirga aurantiaca TaxID=2802615 RepID=A0A934WVM5_9BACT|nr:toll/interleukin-1 receptor domain-containing protein [Marivirga aurantiaca]MBK6263690.1 toll/interleukin-1 receptor domain-containing protein [Marivirga aurantiaca]
MAIITESQFRSIVSQNAGFSGLKGFVNENRIFSKSTSVTSIFLSHSHLDKDKVEQAKIFFEHLGISIYVDWMDGTMPERTNKVTANKIKSKITENEKFILLATNRAVSSKWCNWEVGIGDTYKLSKDNIAILGLADNNRHWTGNEYLQIYPSIEYQDGTKKTNTGTYISKGYYVLYPSEDNSRRFITLEQWLKS